MLTKLHVDNLTTPTTEGELRALFAPHGEVVEVHVSVDLASGRTRGFGFVTMATPEGAQLAIQALSGKLTGRHTLIVSAAWPHEQRAAPAREP